MSRELSELNWKKRLLIISYSQNQNQLLSKVNEFIADNKCELEDRNIEKLFHINFGTYQPLTVKYEIS